MDSIENKAPQKGQNERERAADNAKLLQQVTIKRDEQQEQQIHQMLESLDAARLERLRERIEELLGHRSKGKKMQNTNADNATPRRSSTAVIEKATQTDDVLLRETVMTKNKNQVLQNSQRDRTLRSSTRAPATRQDSYDMSYSEDFGNPAAMRSVHTNNCDQLGAGRQNFDVSPLMGQQDAIYMMETGKREHADYLLTDYNSSVLSGSKRSNMAVTDQSDLKFQYANVLLPLGAFASHRIQNATQQQTGPRSKRLDAKTTTIPFAGYPKNAGARHRQLQALSMSYDAGLDHAGNAVAPELPASLLGHLDVVARQRSQLQTHQGHSRIHVQEMGQAPPETPKL